MANVGICTPHAGSVIPEYYRRIFEMQSNFPQHQFTYVEVDTMIIGKARNVLASTAREYNLDVVFYIDNDTLIPPNAGILIDQALELGVVSGVYFNRRSPYLPQVYKIATEADKIGMYWPLVEYPDDDRTRKEDAAGAGCLCIRIDILKKLEDYCIPMFDSAAKLLDEAYPHIAYMVRNLSPWFEFLNRKGEDMYFCERLRDAGIDLWVNYGVKCAHRSHIDIVEDHFKHLRSLGMATLESEV